MNTEMWSAEVYPFIYQKCGRYCYICSMLTNSVTIGVITSVGASLCCITPVLALFSGVSGVAATFAWIDPVRPYLIGLSLVFLGIAWYQKLRPLGQDDCSCEPTMKRPFVQSTSFLSLITVLAALLMTFPSYAHLFYSNKQSAMVTPTAVTHAVKQVEFSVVGMGCASCEPEVETEVSKLQGIRFVKASCVKKNTVVTFDSSKTTVAAICQAIDRTGYTVQNVKY